MEHWHRLFSRQIARKQVARGIALKHIARGTVRKQIFTGVKTMNYKCDKCGGSGYTKGELGFDLICDCTFNAAGLGSGKQNDIPKLRTADCCDNCKHSKYDEDYEVYCQKFDCWTYKTQVCEEYD
jgi:hypothetical protein